MISKHKFRGFACWYSLVLIFLMNGGLISQSVVIDSQFESVNASRYISIFKDESKAFDIRDVSGVNATDLFVANSKNYIGNRRMPGSNIWLRFSIENQTDKTQDLRLSLASDLLRVDFYQLDESRHLINQSLSGAGMSIFQKPVWYPQTVLPFKLLPQAHHSIYLRIDSDDLNRELVTIKSAQYFEKSSYTQEFVSGIIHGLLLLATIMSLVLFGITKSKVNLYYFLYVLSSTVTFNLASKHFEFLFFPHHPFGHIYQMFSMLLVSIFFFKFILTYYEDQHVVNNTKIRFRLFFIPMLVFLAGIVLYPWVLHLYEAIPLLTRLPMMLLGIMCIYSYYLIIRGAILRPSRNNILFVFAFLAPLFSGAMTILVRNGLLNLGDVFNWAYPISLVLEFTFLSVALSSKVFEAYKERSVYAIRLAAQDKELAQARLLEKALHEKDILLKEIHHRVKNNLQVISALLSLQSRHIKDEAAIKALEEGQGRVQCMALIHQDLYQHDNLKGVNTKDYFEELIENLIDSYSVTSENVELEMDIESILLDVDTMIPLGLVVNELISNTLKHAFTGRSSGRVSVSLRESEKRLILRVRDDGKGTSTHELEQTSFGYSLVQSFASRLGAEINLDGQKGLKVELVIKNYKKAER